MIATHKWFCKDHPKDLLLRGTGRECSCTTVVDLHSVRTWLVLVPHDGIHRHGSDQQCNRIHGQCTEQLHSYPRRPNADGDSSAEVRHDPTLDVWRKLVLDDRWARARRLPGRPSGARAGSAEGPTRDRPLRQSACNNAKVHTTARSICNRSQAAKSTRDKTRQRPPNRQTERKPDVATQQSQRLRLLGLVSARLRLCLREPKFLPPDVRDADPRSADRARDEPRLAFRGDLGLALPFVPQEISPTLCTETVALNATLVFGESGTTLLQGSVDS
mmetsp:Transcript_37243/g.106954  ORF Transcript_37243/g.106954 Transcript_37243/m.106954 type:complete len:274 (+) Transcript_37243:56-877(+)